jgi:hypothetical protein
MRLFLATLLVSLAATSAAADPSPTRDVGKLVSDDCAKARKLKKDCVLTIESHEIEGGTPRATGTTVTILNPGKQQSLIRLRRDFIPEIVKTAEDL